jgi:hypothetical protein
LPEGDPAWFRNHTYASSSASVDQCAGTGRQFDMVATEQAPFRLALVNPILSSSVQGALWFTTVVGERSNL